MGNGNETETERLPSLSVIVPTLREAPNVPYLAHEIADAVRGIVPRWELIVVDDNSGDGIEEICRRLREEGIPLRLVVRKSQRGLATAVIEGFSRATGGVFVVMDGDLSHPPAVVPEFYREICRGTDFVIGSRYLRGGGTDDRWTLYRYLNSKMATLMARPLVAITDPMSGFFGLPRTVWEACRDLSPVGYKIALELIVKGAPRTLKEIPIYFRTRRRGKSKLSVKQQVLYLRHLGRLYRYRLARAVGRHRGPE